MKKSILVGTVGYPIQKSRVQSQVDVVEITETRQLPPGPKTARQWKGAAPGNLEFTLQLSRHFIDPMPPGTPVAGDVSGYGALQITEENKNLFDKHVKVAQALEARAMVFITPSSLTPSTANRRKLRDFIGSLDRSEIPLVWEPHGPWELESSAEFALENKLVLAVDPLRDDPPPGPMAYLRLGPFASMGSRLGVYDLERIAVAMADFDVAMCLFETGRALDDARNLKKLLEGGEEEGDEFDDDF